MPHHFISYSHPEAFEFAIRLSDELGAGPPPVRAWLDEREIKPGQDWDEQIDEAIRTCTTFLFVMTRDSVVKVSPSADWQFAKAKNTWPWLRKPFERRER